MGAYTQRDHLLPFLSAGARDRAVEILVKTVDALRAEGITYRGVLYGGFMLTGRGPVLLEFNARFGDPEGINVLTLYEPQNFSEVLHGVATGRLNPTFLQFRQRSSVVRSSSPGYPEAPKAGGILEIDEPAINDLGVQVRFGAVEAARPGRYTMGSSGRWPSSARPARSMPRPRGSSRRWRSSAASTRSVTTSARRPT